MPLFPRLPALLLLAVGTAFASGCASIRKRPVADHIVSARQLVLRGSDAMQRNKWEEAEYLFAEAIDLSPYEERAHAMYAETLWRRGQRPTAIEHLQESVRLSGGDPHRLVRLGHFYLQTGELERAAGAASSAIRRDQSVADAYALWGDVLTARSQFEEALDRYHEALNIEPQEPQVQMAVANIYQRQNRPIRALSALSVLEEELTPDRAPFELYHLRAVAETTLGRHRAAAKAYRRCAELAPNNPDVLIRLAESQHAAGEVAAARLTIAEALLIAPQHPVAQSLNERLMARTPNATPRF